MEAAAGFASSVPRIARRAARPAAVARPNVARPRRLRPGRVRGASEAVGSALAGGIAKDVAAGSTSLALDRRRVRPPPLSRLRLRRPRRLRRRRSPGVARISPASTRCGPGRSSPSVGPAVVPRRRPPRASDRWATERPLLGPGRLLPRAVHALLFPSEPRPRLSATTRSSIVVAGPTVLRDSRMLRELTSRLRSLPLLNLFFRRRGANECARLPLLPTSVVHTWSSARH